MCNAGIGKRDIFRIEITLTETDDHKLPFVCIVLLDNEKERKVERDNGQHIHDVESVFQKVQFGGTS